MKNSLFLDESYIKGLLPKRDPNGHKGTFGSALLVCGSYSMAGAAVLSGLGANKSGCGLVKQVLPESIYPIVASNVIESVFHIMPQSKDGAISRECALEITTLINGCDSALIGCGMKNTADTKEIIFYAIQNAKVPLVLDADGINCIAGSIDILKKSNTSLILTPHLKEFSRISGLSVEEIISDPVQIARDFASEYNCVLVLKGHNSLVASPDGRLFVNPTGNAGMAKGGSGDVLSGIVVSLSAQGMNAFDAACLAVYIHGLAGDLAAKELTQYAMSATDIIRFLGAAFQKMSKD